MIVVSILLFKSCDSKLIQTIYVEELLDKAVKPVKRKVSTQDAKIPATSPLANKVE